MTKSRYLLVIFLLILVLCLIWTLGPPRRSTPGSVIDERTRGVAQIGRGAEDAPRDNLSAGHVPQVEAGRALPDGEAIKEFVANTRADPQYEWKQPISFYGKVVDENEQPVSGASVVFKWNDLSASGTSSAEASSAGDGLFSLRGQLGKRLYVQIAKDGYYNYPSNPVAFEYANPADGLFTPDPNHPVVFHLRRKGAGGDLLSSQQGFKDYLGVAMPLDTTSVRVNLLERKTDDHGQLLMSQSKPPYQKWKEADRWSFRIEIPGGGLVEQLEEFPFHAPESGYQSVVQFDFQRGSTNWTTSLQRDFYIKFGTPPLYGRLHLDTMIEMQGARLTYVVNTQGARNLEPK